MLLGLVLLQLCLCCIDPELLLATNGILTEIVLMMEMLCTAKIDWRLDDCVLMQICFHLNLLLCDQSSVLPRLS